jgi:hypothetical protein
MSTVQACSLLPVTDAVVEAVGVRRVDADVAVGAEGVEAVVAVVAGVAVAVAVVVAAAVAVFGLALSASVKRVPPPAGWIST